MYIMKRILWKIFFWIVNIFVIGAILSANQDGTKHLVAHIIETSMWFSYSFALYAFLYRKINIRLFFWKLMLWINTIYYFLYIFYELTPTAPVIKNFSVFQDNGKPDRWIDVFLTLLFILPVLYAIFKLSKGFSLAVKDFGYRKLFNMLTQRKNFYKSVIRFGKAVKKFFVNLSKVKKILLGVVLIIILLLGSIYGYSRYLLSQAEDQILSLEKVLDEFMIYETNKEYKNAYNLFSDQFTDYNDLNTFITSSEYEQPEMQGYIGRSLFLDNFWINFYIGQPIFLKYQGHFLYENGDEGQVDATFILEGNKLELYGINITAPPSRFNKFIPPQEKK